MLKVEEHGDKVMSDLQQANIIQILPAVRRTATGSVADIDIQDYEGPCQLILTSSAGGGTTPTLDVTLHHATSSGGSYAAVSAGVFTQLTDAADVTSMIALNCSDLRRFVKGTATISGTSPTFDCSLVLVARKKAGRNASQVV